MDNLSDNLIGEGESLADGYTLMGVKLEIHTDSSQWEFIVKGLPDTPQGGWEVGHGQVHVGMLRCVHACVCVHISMELVYT